MSSEDPVRPYHAKNKATGKEAADAVAAVLKHAAERDEAALQKAPARKPSRWMLPVGINLGVFALYLLIAPPAWVVVDPLEGPPLAKQVDDYRLAMYMQIQRIEAYRIDHGRLPGALADAGSPVPGVQYRIAGSDTYFLSASVGPDTLVYDSTQPASQWAAGLTDRLLGGG